MIFYHVVGNIIYPLIINNTVVLLIELLKHLYQKNTKVLEAKDTFLYNSLFLSSFFCRDDLKRKGSC